MGEDDEQTAALPLLCVAPLFNAAFSLPSSPTFPLGCKNRGRELLRDCVQIANKIAKDSGKISIFIEKKLKNNDLHSHYTSVQNIVSWQNIWKQNGNPTGYRGKPCTR